jgi:glycosyltransferase involved in cell wall biosynthesis
MLNATVIISTRNRATILPRLFEALAKQILSSNSQWELILINNGSTDETAGAINEESLRNRLPLVTLFEPLPGKSRALNLAIKHSLGDILVFTDDDVEPEPTWLQSYISASLTYPDINGFAGKVLPKWLGDLPDWLHTEGQFALPRGITNTRDFGCEQIMLPVNVIPGGVNTALKKTAVTKNGWFKVELGPGTNIPFTEDTDYFKRYKKTGGTFLYVPNALLYHCNVPERMTQDYVIQWIVQVGRCQILAFSNVLNIRNLAGIPLYLLHQAVKRAVIWCLEPRSQHRFQKKMKCMLVIGKIKGYWQLNNTQTRQSEF